uniref:Uncharacterized protein n=1 Tax=Avena sativa TaxID=4498 RepID=A0ACD5VH37_AVESA
MAGAALTVVAVVAAVAPLLLAGVVRADCFSYCFKNCIAKDKSMTDYCNYACDKTCDPGAPQRPLDATAAGSDIGCELACARTSCKRLGPDCMAVETCFGRCYDGCKAKPLPRPLRAGVSTASGPDDAATEKHPFHEKQDGFRPSSEVPDPEDGSGHPIKEFSSLNCYFHEKQDDVHPASEQRRTPLSEIHAAPPGPL